MNGTQDIFFHCNRCGSILNEADIAFDENKTGTCANCLVGRGNFSVYLVKKKKTVPFYLFNAFRWLFPYFLWGELLYRLFLSNSFYLQGLLATFSSTAGWVGFAFDIVLMVSGVAAVICICAFGFKSTILESYTRETKDDSGRIWRTVSYVEHPVLNFFIVLWDIILFIFMSLVSLLGIIILIIIIAHQCAKNQKDDMRLSRQEKSLCARYRKILKEKNKRCWKCAIFSDAELKRRRDNYNYLVPMSENMSVDGNKYFLCGSKDVYNGDKKDKIYFLARPCEDHVEYEFLYSTAFIYFGGCNCFIPYQADGDIIENQSSYFPVPPKTIMECKKFLKKYYGDIKKI